MAHANAYAELIRRKQEQLASGQKRRVALLLRVSDKKQAKDDQDVPIPVQRDYCLRLVEKRPEEWEIATHNGVPIEYTEAGVSAFKISKDDRELLTSAMADAAADRFDILVILWTATGSGRRCQEVRRGFDGRDGLGVGTGRNDAL